MDGNLLVKCKKCDHFVERNHDADDNHSLCEFIHLDDGDKDHNHDAEPGQTKSLDEWKTNRPDLFIKHIDGKIGPNSLHHVS